MKRHDVVFTPEAEEQLVELYRRTDYCVVLPASWPNPLVQLPLWISPELLQPSVTGAVHCAQVTVFPKFHAQSIHGPA